MKTPGRGMLWLLGVAVAGCGGGGGGPGPGPTPAQVLVSGGENQVGPAGQELATPLEVTVKDASGTPMVGITVSWAVGSGGGTVTPSSSSGADGKAVATRRLGPGAGAQTATATVSGVAPALFHHIAQIQGATQIAANVSLTRSDSVLSTVPFSAVVRDQNNQVVAGVIVTWTLAGGTGTLSQQVDTTDANGITSTNLILDQTAAPRSVQAAVTGLQGSPVVFLENAVAGNAIQIALNGGNSQVGPVSTVLPTAHSVIVQDAYGNPKSGFTVSWALGLGGGSLSATTPVTNASGIAPVIRTLGPIPGLNTDTARADGLSGSPVVFSDSAVAVENISVSNNFFNPAATTISAGTFVKFTWAGGVSHNVTWDSGPNPLPTNSVTQSSGAYQVRLTLPGSYAYHCTIHGAAMSGSITVN